MNTPGLTTSERAALDVLATDLGRIFGTRLHALVAYGFESRRPDSPIHSLALVERVTFEDLAVCVPSTDRWLKLGLEVPLLMGRDEFRRTLDVFPLEYGDILASHVLIAGRNPFDGTQVADADRRRACELQAKSHLIHLREGFLESGGDPRRITSLIAASAPAFRTVLFHIVELAGRRSAAGHGDDDDLAADAEAAIGVSASVVREVLAAPAAASTVADPTALLSRYIEAAEAIWRYVDQWRGA